MAAQRTTHSITAPHRRRIRTAAVIAGVAFLTAAGGYAATTTFGPDAHEPQPAPATDDTPTTTDQVRRELHESIARQYGPQLAPERLARQPLVGRPQAASPDREQAMRDYRQTVIKLYGPRPSRSVSGR